MIPPPREFLSCLNATYPGMLTVVSGVCSSNQDSTKTATSGLLFRTNASTSSILLAMERTLLNIADGILLLETHRPECVGSTRVRNLCRLLRAGEALLLLRVVLTEIACGRCSWSQWHLRKSLCTKRYRFVFLGILAQFFSLKRKS